MNNPNFKDNNLKPILGPTNTGKTFYAMERMLSHASGMIGFPLRLLARENYDKAVNVVGLNKVLLLLVKKKLFQKTQSIFVVQLKRCRLKKSCFFMC